MHSDKPLEGRFTLLIDQERGTTVEVEDYASGETMLRIKITPGQTLAFLSRQVYVKCEFTTGRLEHVGKELEVSKYSVKMPENFNDSIDKTIATNRMRNQCPEGWEPDCYFDSQRSFYTKDKQNYAQCTIRRWI